MRICIVLPTYNEKENILPLLHKLMNYPVDVLIVDDNSPDGTGEAVKKHPNYKKNIFLLQGKKEGLGKAYLRGFTWALKKHYDVIFEMDADFSHDPKAIPLFLAGIKNADFIIGSRYSKKGKILGWSFKRKIMSKIANILVSLFLGIQVKDATSGYRAIRASLLKKILQKNIKTKGYGIQISLLFFAQQLGATIKEIPIVFKEREKGKSKLGKKDVLEFLAIMIFLFFQRWKKAEKKTSNNSVILKHKS